MTLKKDIDHYGNISRELLKTKIKKAKYAKGHNTFYGILFQKGPYGNPVRNKELH